MNAYEMFQMFLDDQHSWGVRDIHLVSTLREMSPVYGGDQGMNATFKKLFDKKMEVWGQQGFKISHLYQFSNGIQANLEISEPEGFRDVLRLYYGMRCAFTHGKVEKTLNGALEDFPKEANGLKVAGTTICTAEDKSIKHYEVSKDLMNLYSKIVKEKSRAKIEYSDLLNMTRFLKRCARMLFLVMQTWIHTTFSVLVWDCKGVKN